MGDSSDGVYVFLNAWEVISSVESDASASLTFTFTQDGSDLYELETAFAVGAPGSEEESGSGSGSGSGSETKKKFPLLLVIGGVVLVGALLYFRALNIHRSDTVNL